DLVSSEEHFTQSLEIHYPGQNLQSYAFISEPGIASYTVSSVGLWMLGFPHKALERIRQAVALAHRQSDFRTLGNVLWSSAYLCSYLNDYPGILEHSEAVLALSREKDIADYLVWATILHGYALAMQDRLEEGIAEIREGLAAVRMTGAELHAPDLLYLLVKALMKARRIEEGLSYLDEALTIISRNGERYYEAEIYRLKGALLLQS